MANSSAIRVFSSGGVVSTPTSDTRAVQARGNELETALHLLESEAAAFAKTVVVDPAARKEGVSFAGGAIGGAIGSAAVLAMVSNPGGWIVGAAMFAGAMGGGLGSSELFDYFWPER